MREHPTGRVTGWPTRMRHNTEKGVKSMANGFLVLDEQDWEGATPEQRDWMIFKTLKSLDARMSKLEKRPVVDKCFAFLGGVIGGFAAAIGIKMGGP